MPLQIGDRAPAIRSGSFDLSKLRGKRGVLFFFPKSDTPGCTKEACEFRDASKKFSKLDAEIVGVSPDQPEAQSNSPQSTASSIHLCQIRIMPSRNPTVCGRKRVCTAENTWALSGPRS